MAKEQSSMLMILGVFAAMFVAFWLGRQSVLQSKTVTTPSNSINSATGTNSSANSKSETGIRKENPNQGTNTPQQEKSSAQLDVSPVQESPETELTDDIKQLLADIDLAGIELEALQVYLKAWELLDRDFYGENPEGSKRLYASIRGLIESYDDPYTFFIEPQTNEVEQGNLRGSFGGIGAYVENSDAGFTLRPMRDQPAERAGVQEGDLLTSIDDVPIHIDMPVDDVVALIRGPLDTDVNITILRLDDVENDDVENDDVENDDVENDDVENDDVENDDVVENGETLSFTITRSEIQTPSMDWQLLSAGQFQNEQWENPVNLERINQIGYIRHHIFSDRSPAEMHTALEELQGNGAEYFILDLRGNPGGPVNAVVQTTDLWIESGGIMQEVNAQGRERLFEATAEVAVADEALIIIVDGGSASASEILAGALQDHGRATLLGEKTFGKGSVQIIYPLPDNSSVHITNATWLTPNGNIINKQGLDPDILIEPGTDPLPQSISTLLDLNWIAPKTDVVDE